MWPRRSIQSLNDDAARTAALHEVVGAVAEDADVGGSGAARRCNARQSPLGLRTQRAASMHGCNHTRPRCMQAYMLSYAS